MKKHLPVLAALLLVACALPLSAAPVPSKVVANQSLEARNADLAVIHDVVSNEVVATALAQHGFTQAQVEQRMAQLSTQDVHQLAQNLNQLQAAGLTRQEWTWIAIGAVAVIIIIAAVS